MDLDSCVGHCSKLNDIRLAATLKLRENMDVPCTSTDTMICSLEIASCRIRRNMIATLQLLAQLKNEKLACISEWGTTCLMNPTRRI